MSAPTVVLVHGAWHGAWCWDAVRAGLEARGIDVVTQDLPFTAALDDVDSVIATLDRLESAVLVGHSYGGLVITQAALERTDVSHLVYVCAFMAEEGEDVRRRSLEFPTVALTVGMVHEDDGWFSVDPEIAPDAFYQECSPAEVERALSRLRPMRRGPVREYDRAPWRDIPSTYAVCARDQAIHPDFQREMAARATHTVEWDTDHSPFVSRPDDVVELLAATVARVEAEGG
ncbi:MAG: alpha/beta fold hydrolase [Actinomycetia bacterium]|nr:alpha/beta fold hydrolase [Actinomycetes bacterium]MCP4085510.1 alpha/beta fold hydrolase [Actinomycetes bacterium]